MTGPRATPSRLALAQRIVDEVAPLALAAFQSRGTLAARAKKPQDFVSDIDEQVERLLRERLTLAFPGEAVVGEEYGGDFSATNWVIDPIDGTANFLRGIPLWSISLGFVQDGRPEAGVVAMPALGLSVGAQRGAGLFCNGAPVRRDETFGEVRVMSLGDSNDDFDIVAHTSARLRRAGWVVEAYRSTATALAFAALGRLDGHVQHLVKVWDMAAGLVLCAEAGLEVRHAPLAEADNHVFAGTAALLSAFDAA